MQEVLKNMTVLNKFDLIEGIIGKCGMSTSTDSGLMTVLFYETDLIDSEKRVQINKQLEELISYRIVRLRSCIIRDHAAVMVVEFIR